MKRILILCFILTTIHAYSQNDIGEFKLLKISDVDSALMVLTMSANQQFKKAPVSVDVTKEYIAQNREVTRVDWLWTLTAVTRTIPRMMYYNNITNIHVHYGWEIEMISTTTGKVDYIILKDLRMAEKALAALLCLIKNSGNENYDNIIIGITTLNKY